MTGFVKALAQARNLTIAEIARQANLSYHVASRLYHEHAKRPRAAEVIALARVLGVSTTVLPFTPRQDAAQYAVNWSTQPLFHFDPFTTSAGAHLGILGIQARGTTRALKVWAQQAVERGIQVAVLDPCTPHAWASEAPIHTLQSYQPLTLNSCGWTVTTCMPETMRSASAVLRSLYATLVDHAQTSHQPHILIIEHVETLVAHDPLLITVLACALPVWQMHNIHVWWSATPDILAQASWRDLWRALPGRAIIGPNVDLALLIDHHPILTAANFRMLHQNHQANLLLSWRDAKTQGWHVGQLEAS